MPVLSKAEHQKLLGELRERYAYLYDLLESRQLSNAKEGARGGCWQHPEKMCATKGDAIDIRIVLADFKTILAEIGRLK
jgi:hypothetical protein